jgi:hypothetical protein
VRQRFMDKGGGIVGVPQSSDLSFGAVWMSIITRDHCTPATSAGGQRLRLCLHRTVIATRQGYLHGIMTVLCRIRPIWTLRAPRFFRLPSVSRHPADAKRSRMEATGAAPAKIENVQFIFLTSCQVTTARPPFVFFAHLRIFRVR